MGPASPQGSLWPQLPVEGQAQADEQGELSADGQGFLLHSKGAPAQFTP